MQVENTFVVTVDVDGWSSLLRFYHIDHDPSEADVQVNIDEGIQKLLRLFKEHVIKATFFVTGEMARKHAETIGIIGDGGHEIACHGLMHEKDECLRNTDSQRRTIKEATRTLHQKTGYRPKGFRAPCLRANETTLRILEELGFVYDSSLLPTFVPGYYGNLTTPFKPYHPSTLLMTRKGSFSLLEIPVSVNPVFRLPLSAAWMRNLGASYVKLGVKMNFTLGNPVVLYVHPRDVVSLPKIKGVPWHLYKNVGDPTVRMLDKILKYAETLGARFVRGIDLAKNMAMID